MVRVDHAAMPGRGDARHLNTCGCATRFSAAFTIRSVLTLFRGMETAWTRGGANGTHGLPRNKKVGNRHASNDIARVYPFPEPLYEIHKWTCDHHRTLSPWHTRFRCQPHDGDSWANLLDEDLSPCRIHLSGAMLAGEELKRNTIHREKVMSDGGQMDVFVQ